MPTSKLSKASRLATLATSLTIGIAAVSTPAQAASISGAGGFNLNGTTSVTGAGTSSPTLNFNNGFKIIAGEGVFAGLKGTPIIKSLLLNDNNPTPNTDAVLSSGPVPNFITGLLFQNGDPFSFDLDATGSGLYGDIISEDMFDIAGPVSGIFRADNTVIGRGFVAGLSFGPGASNNLSNISLVTTQEVPSPALLPGLVGMGVAALRKRKKEEDVETQNN